MLKKLAILVGISLVVFACGNETPHATPSFISLEHDYEGDYINQLIAHVHDTTWHIPYSTDVAKNFEPALRKAVQIWLQPLRRLGLSRNIVSDFKFYQHPPDNLHGSNVPWEKVLFRIRFSVKSIGEGVLGEYTSVYVPSGSPKPVLTAEQKPSAILYKVDEAATEAVTDSLFMFALVHELGHAFGLADTYTVHNGTLGRRGKQPSSVMASDYYAFNYPQFFSAGNNIKLANDDIKGLLWLYEKQFTDNVDSLADCYFDDYQYEDDPAGCVPNSDTQPTEPEPIEPEPVEPSEPIGIAAQCCAENFRCARWPGKADIHLCRARQTFATDDGMSPCCQPEAYECEAWPGRAVAAVCFAL